MPRLFPRSCLPLFLLIFTPFIRKYHAMTMIISIYTSSLCGPSPRAALAYAEFLSSFRHIAFREGLFSQVIYQDIHDLPLRSFTMQSRSSFDGLHFKKSVIGQRRTVENADVACAPAAAFATAQPALFMGSKCHAQQPRSRARIKPCRAARWRMPYLRARRVSPASRRAQSIEMRALAILTAR